MKSVLLIIALFCLQPIFGQTMPAKQDEENEDPLFKNTAQHGGELVDAGKYKFEVLVNPMQAEDKLIVYVLKKSYKQIEFKKGVGSVVCRYKDGKTDTIRLNNQVDRFTTNQFDPTKIINMIFNFTLDNKNMSGVYFYKGITNP